jgi:hypothetical protein
MAARTAQQHANSYIVGHAAAHSLRLPACILITATPLLFLFSIAGFLAAIPDCMRGHRIVFLRPRLIPEK